MIENNRIIIVDDADEDLQKLSDVFHKYGIGCKTFRYDGFNFPDTPLKGVRFAFLIFIWLKVLRIKLYSQH